MLNDFLIRAVLAGLGIGILSSILGCFLLWKRIAFLGDALSHSSIFGIALGVILSLSFHVSVFIIALIFALLFLYLENHRNLSQDTILAILSQFMLAAGLILLSLNHIPNISIHNYLFGNILTVTRGEIYFIYTTGLLILILLKKFWDPLLLTTIDEDLAKSEGIPVLWIKFMLLLLMILTVTISLKIIGAFLMSALLIFPSSTARILSQSLRQMICLSVLFSILSIVSGLGISFLLDTPAGTSIISVSGLYFFITLFTTFFTKKYSP